MKYDITRRAVLIGVRELCEAACLSGDLSSRTPADIPDGGALHRLLASRAGPGFTAEVPLELPIRDGGIDFVLRGRADGVIESAAPGTLPTVVEIKTVNESALSSPPHPAQTAQLCTYAFMLCRLRDLPSIIARMTMSTEDGDKIRRIEKTYTSDELEAMLRGLLGKIRRRAENEVTRATEILPAASALTFPHRTLRDGQRELIGAVFSAVKGGKRLFAQAPTGIGKTVSVLYGAARAWGGGEFRRIFYLTAKASTRREAYAAAGRLCAAGAVMRTVVLTAKEQICPVSGASSPDGFLCDPDSCPMAKGYFDRRDAAVNYLLDSYHGYPASVFSQTAAKFNVCPYELSLDLSEYCDIIICDYNYAFDPGVKLRRYFGPDAPRADAVFLVDEAHNLPERARDIYSAVLTEDDVGAMRRFTSASPATDAPLAALGATLASQRTLCADSLVKDDDGEESGYYFNRDPLPDLGERVAAAAAACEIFFFSHRADRPAACAAAAFMRLCRKFTGASEAYSERYRTYVEVSHGRVGVKLYCLDPSERLDEALDEARAAVFFSATLTPADYFADVLGGGKTYRSISLPSPFPQSNLYISAVTSISTRFEDREKSARKIAQVIAVTASAKPGNYIVYLPSYRFLDSVLEPFRARYPKVALAVQRRGMSRGERESFLAFFKADTGRLRIGFCVLGGSFSEGVDLPGSRLIGTVVVGVGLPGLSAERNIIRDYFETKLERGYDYAYTYPGMNNILQAAGRVIRRDDDRGVVILVDDRYATPLYRELMPPHWAGIRMPGDVQSLGSELHLFWNGEELPEHDEESVSGRGTASGGNTDRRRNPAGGGDDE